MKMDRVIEEIEPGDKNMMEEAQKRLDGLAKPLGSLGRLEEIAKRVVGMTRKENPPVRNKVIFTMAGDHGVVQEGVSAYPQEVTSQMVYNFIRGGAGINVLSRHVGARVVVVDIGVKTDIKCGPSDIRDRNTRFKVKKVNYGTKDFTVGPAMTREEAIRSIEAGIEVFEEEGGIDIVGTGDMGIGNTTPSSAITAVFTKEKAKDVTGRGTGIDDATLSRKIDVIKKGIEVNEPDPADAIDVLSKVGGFEIGGLAGVMLAGARVKIPVLIDGFISAAAALIAYGLAPAVKDYLIASHCSVERGHRVILDYIGLQPMFDFDMRLGEGTGAALGMGIVEAAVKILTEMATFESAGVSKKSI